MKQGNSVKISSQDSKRYVFDNKKDIEIFKVSKLLLSRKLKKGDREMVELIISQLKKEWRGPLLKKLKDLKNRYV